MCFITVTAATVLVNVVYHGNERHGNGNYVFHGNVTTVITEGSPEIFDVLKVITPLYTPREVGNFEISKYWFSFVTTLAPDSA